MPSPLRRTSCGYVSRISSGRTGASSSSTAGATRDHPPPARACEVRARRWSSGWSGSTELRAEDAGRRPRPRPRTSSRAAAPCSAARAGRFRAAGRGRLGRRRRPAAAPRRQRQEGSLASHSASTARAVPWASTSSAPSRARSSRSQRGATSEGAGTICSSAAASRASVEVTRWRLRRAGRRRVASSAIWSVAELDVEQRVDGEHGRFKRVSIQRSNAASRPGGAARVAAEVGGADDQTDAEAWHRVPAPRGRRRVGGSAAAGSAVASPRVSVTAACW